MASEAKLNLQMPQEDEHSIYQDYPLSTDKIDCERGLGRGVPKSNSMWSLQTCPRLLKLVGLLAIALLVQCFWPMIQSFSADRPRIESLPDFGGICPQAEALIPPKHRELLGRLDEKFKSVVFRDKAYISLEAAIAIRSESYDHSQPSNDPQWEPEFHEYLNTRFPKVHSTLHRTVVNKNSLLYEWKGTGDMKPLLISAHMDVVPVNNETVGEWDHAPYSGLYDGEWIWGRGSCDDKARVIASLTAVESLLELGFTPYRTVLLAFGNDEETGGEGGAAFIKKHLIDTYGPDSLAMIIEEGGEFTVRDGKVFATPAVAEKGYLDIHIGVSTPGGHSSRPPPHTGIGILADLIANIEADPHKPQLYRERTYYQALECRARYDTNFPADLKELVWRSEVNDEPLRELEVRLMDYDPMFYALSGTTQAVDLIQGGVKVNALPEYAWAAINHRIADFSTVDKVKERFLGITRVIAEKYGMTLEAYGEKILSGPPEKIITIFVPEGKSVEPSPVSPTRESGAYQLLSGTIRSTFETHLRTDGLPKEAIVSPGLMTPNTDSHHYLDLTRHIFRYGHRRDLDAYNGVHTINEAIRAEGYLEQIRFFTRIIVNADQNELLD